VPAPAPIRPIPVLYEDEHLLVVCKPAGMLSVPDLSRRLRDLGYGVEPVHLLDRDVSGALLLARTPRARAGLEALFRERRLRKTYWALAAGRVTPPEGELHDPILEERGRARVSARGLKALTRYRTLASHATTSELEVDLVTGRYNQIRLHFAHAGFPLVGERKYARGGDSPLRLGSRRVALHAWRLELEHPVTGAPLAVQAPLPDDLIALRERAAGA
jgi:RluA family pseudouridine synthase